MTTKGKDTIIEKLAKLRAHEESARAIGNATEAAAFAEKFRELLVKHELTMSDVEYAQEKKEDPVAMKWSSGGKRRRILWSEDLAKVVARHFFCRILVSDGTDAICFVGRQLHREMAEFVFVRLRDQIEYHSNLEYKKLRKRIRRENGDLKTTATFEASFRRGFIVEVARRFREMRTAEERQLAGTGVALVRLNQALVAVDDWFKEKEKEIKVAKEIDGSAAINALGEQIGREHGSKADLSANGIRPSVPVAAHLKGGN